MVIMHSFTLFYLLITRIPIKSLNLHFSSATAQNNNSGPNIQMPVPGNPVVSMGGTNLNMGMDLWNPSVGNGTMKMRSNPSGVSRTVVPPPMMPDQWVQVV